MGGPKLSAISRIPYWLVCLRGNGVQWIARLHEVYGSVVRFGPNDLSYTDSQAWKDICTTPKGRRENGKDALFHGPANSGAPQMIIDNDPEHHNLVRRQFAPAFSEKSLKAQEPLLQKYANLLVARGREAAVTATVVNMTKLFNFTTFDSMADMTFGESLHMLENNQYSEWVEGVLSFIRILPFIQLLKYYPILDKIFELIEPKSIAKMRLDNYNYTARRVDKRLEAGAGREEDVWNLVIRSGVVSKEEMYSNAELLMIAGTETTGLTYYLGMNRDKMKILTDEIRRTFSHSSEITLEALAKLENPEKFAPERWLRNPECDPEYADDNREAHQPFSVGPRNCVGLNLAWHEMRLLLAKVVYNFDIELQVGPDWREQNAYLTWDRKPLMCRLREVNDTAVASS
ncbi:hypothetical protein SLS62_006077 [Diatrype stigma]|uniref:Cytochrome P450 n=1 Tax=Diatrype stigma TaxID=117547 RepID=A0AAN9UZ59_9PEZI